MTAPKYDHLNAEMATGLHSLKHGRWLSRSMADGLAHFGYAERHGGLDHAPEYRITDRGLAYLERAGACRPPDERPDEAGS